MSKISRPRGLAKSETNIVLAALQNDGTVSTDKLTSLGIRGRYLFKYIFALRNDGHRIVANREGRKVVSYTLVTGVDKALTKFEEAVKAA